MQFWPRKKAADIVPRIRTWHSKDAKAACFAGYKVGMTHVMATDNRNGSPSKNMSIAIPVTIIECPPMKVYGIAIYEKNGYGLQCASTILATSLDKHLPFPLPKNIKAKFEDVKEPADVRLLVQTQPQLINLKKTPEVFQVGLGGSVEAKLAYAKEILGKEIAVTDVFKEGSLVDVHAVTKGKGLQGPVKRFGVKIRFHKSEKTKRGPGSLGPWHGPTLYRVPHAGQMGFQTRTELNKWVLKIDTDPSKINIKGGFVRYGDIKSQYMLVKGSISGARKRLIKFTPAQRPDKKIPVQAPAITYVSQTSQQ